MSGHPVRRDHLTTEEVDEGMLNYREEFILYGLRKLGHPVVEVNIADEQIEEVMQDTVSFFQNRHMAVSYTHLRAHETV